MKLKTTIASIILLLPLLFPPSATAQECESITDPVECGYHPNCMVSGNQCITNSNPNPVGFGAASSTFALIDPLHNKFATPADIANSLLPYLFTIAGLVLFGMLIAGGFTMLTAATDPKKAEAGKTRITNAVVGFIIIFVAYWLTQILEIILGVKIL